MPSRNHLLVAFLLGLAATARAEAPSGAAGLAARIDRYLGEAWERGGIAASGAADDATYLRRVSLDLIGRIPTVAEARAYLEDRNPERRARVVARLLDSGAHARHFATFWRRVWLPQADTPQFAGLADEFERWLAVRLRDETPYDRLVRELLTVPPGARPTPAPARGSVGPPHAFLVANQSLPENLAASTTRAFLGINLECAQCHDHPFARWTRDQFWETAAFFSRPATDEETRTRRIALAVPNTKRVVTPRLLDGVEPRWPGSVEADTGRRVLAGWIVDGGNAYFARNAVNRLWAQFFGAGLVEPLDDLSAENPAGQPALLDELARAFADGGFDLKGLIAAIVLSRAYNLSAAGANGDTSDADARLFARMSVRGLTGEQLYDSLRIAAGLPAERDDLDPAEALQPRRRFAAQFHNDRAIAAERSITQALTLINGRMTAGLTDPGKTPILAATADAPFLDNVAKVETLFLAALGRLPTPEERVPLVAHVDRGGATADPRKALADVFWALINSSEFNTNH